MTHGRTSVILAVGILTGAIGYGIFRGDIRWEPRGSSEGAPTVAESPATPPSHEASAKPVPAQERSAPPEPINAPKATRRQSASDWLIVPGVRVGEVRPDATEPDLRRIYGDENVGSADVYLGEGESEPGTAIFPNDPMQTLHVLWTEDQSRRPREVRVLGTRWRTEDGIGIGTTLRELEKINAGAFELAGFGWDYSGTVYGWLGGRLDRKLESEGRMLVRLSPRDTGETMGDEVSGERGVRSDHPAMQALNPAVYAIAVQFPEARARRKQTPEGGEEAGAGLIGLWTAERTQGYLAIDLAADGTFRVETRSYATRRGRASGAATGRWRVSGGRFEGRIDHSQTLAFPPGYSWSDEIIEASEERLVLKNAIGGIESYRREDR